MNLKNNFVMKKLALLLMTIVLVFSCTKEDHSTIEPQGEFIEVPINLSGIDISTEPLSKATGSIDYGIQVFAVFDSKEIPYAWGDFIEGKLSTTKIKLKRGSTYKFCCTALNRNNGINTVSNIEYLNKREDDYKYYFFYPYNVVDSATSGFSTDQFYYTEKQMFNYKDPGRSIYGTDVYYGECTYTVNSETPIVINTERVSAGIVIQSEFNKQILGSTFEIILNTQEAKALMTKDDILLVTPKNFTSIEESPFEFTVSTVLNNIRKQISLSLKPNEKTTVRINFGGDDSFPLFQVNLPESVLKDYGIIKQY